MEADFQEELSVRPIRAEEAFARQNDRIAYLRSFGLPWGEAVMELRDQLVGLEDDEFWDGIPDKVRATLDSLPVPEQKLVRKNYADRGWATMSMATVEYEGPDGEIHQDFQPTPDDLSRALRCVRSLAARLRITWQTVRRSHLGYRRDHEEGEMGEDASEED